MSKLPDDFEFIGFIILRGLVYYEPCDCCSTDKCRPSSWGEMAEVFNTEKEPKILEKYQQFWALD